jgi:hypothetical protein
VSLLHTKEKVKLCLQHAVETHRVVRRRGSHIFYAIGSKMLVSLKSHPTFTPGGFLVLISVTALVDSRAEHLEAYGVIGGSFGHRHRTVPRGGVYASVRTVS